jgi:predicted MFS family arabinose efflux permease
MTGLCLILALCAAEVLTMAGVFAFPALLPTFVGEWGLSKTEAGWIAGLYFAAYAVTAPPVLALTDRLDARRVYLGGALLAASSAAGFALFADGFWTALLFRALAGASLAATYLPGLRVLMDRYHGPRPSRALSFYTSSFSLGTALSFLLAGEMASAFGWRSAFAATAATALLAAAVPLWLSPASPERPEGAPRLLDFRPVLANRRARAYILGYGVHCWELFAMRSWLVTFLAFCLSLQPSDAITRWLSPTSVATASGLMAMAASIGGNELCVRFGRRRVITLVMLASALLAAGFGFTAPLAYGLVAALSLAYAAIIQLDSAALTAGAVESALPGQRGATLAVHGLIGFGCAGIGPLVLGMVLDATCDGATTLSWGLAFASLALVGLLGPLALRIAGRG